jgi:hypothetical protein
MAGEAYQLRDGRWFARAHAPRQEEVFATKRTRREALRWINAVLRTARREYCR